MKSYNAEIKKGNLKPFEVIDAITICSYQFAKSKATDLLAIPWDLVVIDEAHRLRDVYKTTNVIANTLKLALANVPNKLLLTATPLQNSLPELFGLVSFIDERVFGDLKSFKEQYSRLNDNNAFDSLKSRLRPICHRTLRRQVTAYVPYTKRHPIVQPFTPEESEDRLYDLVSEYLRRDNLQALPASQRTLMTLVLRKLLASSTFAIAGALESIISRLKRKLGKEPPVESLEEELNNDSAALQDFSKKRKMEIQQIVSERNAHFFEEEAKKLDNWADDMKVMLEREIKEFDRQIRDIKRTTVMALNLEEKLAGQKQIRALEATRNGKRKSLFEAQDEIDRKRDELIEMIEGKLQAGTATVELFTISWELR